MSASEERSLLKTIEDAAAKLYAESNDGPRLIRELVDGRFPNPRMVLGTGKDCGWADLASHGRA